MAAAAAVAVWRARARACARACVRVCVCVCVLTPSVWPRSSTFDNAHIISIFCSPLYNNVYSFCTVYEVHWVVCRKLQFSHLVCIWRLRCDGGDSILISSRYLALKTNFPVLSYSACLVFAVIGPRNCGQQSVFTVGNPSLAEVCSGLSLVHGVTFPFPDILGPFLLFPGNVAWMISFYKQYPFYA